MTVAQSKTKKDEKGPEPSMEEILSSIRRIIAEDQKQNELDGDPQSAKNKGRLENFSGAPEEDDLIIELVKNADEEQIAPEIASSASAPLLSSETASKATNHFQKLRGTTQISGESQTLDGVVREMLRPLLQEWLNAHLPELVERIVRHEIERIAQSK